MWKLPRKQPSGSVNIVGNVSKAVLANRIYASSAFQAIFNDFVKLSW